MYNMTRIIMSGCNGAMGTTITKIVSEDAEAEIVAGIDIVDDGSKDYPVFSSIKDCDVEADAVIDFSTPKILDDLLAYCEEKKVPVVLCTTIVPPRTALIPSSFLPRFSLLWERSKIYSYRLSIASLTASARASAVPDGASSFWL